MVFHFSLDLKFNTARSTSSQDICAAQQAAGGAVSATDKASIDDEETEGAKDVGFEDVNGN